MAIDASAYIGNCLLLVQVTINKSRGSFKDKMNKLLSIEQHTIQGWIGSAQITEVVYLYINPMLASEHHDTLSTYFASAICPHFKVPDNVKLFIALPKDYTVYFSEYISLKTMFAFPQY